MSWEAVPGSSPSAEAHGETTVVVERDRLVEACTHLRDEEGFNFLSDITPADYLGWGEKGVAGYIGTRRRPRPHADLGAGLPAPAREPKPARFCVNYHLLALRDGAPRLRVQVWLEDGEPVPSVDRRLADAPTGTSARPGT